MQFMSQNKRILPRTTTINRLTKRVFDPSNLADLKEYRHFVTNGTWTAATCPFEVEWPYLSIPQMIQERITEHYLLNVLKIDD